MVKNKTKKYLGGSARSSENNARQHMTPPMMGHPAMMGQMLSPPMLSPPMLSPPMGYSMMNPAMMGPMMGYHPMMGPIISPAMMGYHPMLTPPMGYPMMRPAMMLTPPMGYPMMNPAMMLSPKMSYPMMSPPMSGYHENEKNEEENFVNEENNATTEEPVGGAEVTSGPTRRKLKKRGILGKINKTRITPNSVRFQRTFNSVNKTPVELTNANNILLAPPSRKLEKVRTIGRDTIYDLLQFPDVRTDFTRIIHDKLLKSGTGIDIIAPLPEYPTINPNYYLNFNVNGLHLSIHYDREKGGKAGHIHVTNDAEICRILIIYDSKTHERFIGGCYQNISKELVYLSNICVDAIIELLFKHSGLVLTKKEICNS